VAETVGAPWHRDTTVVDIAVRRVHDLNDCVRGYQMNHGEDDQDEETQSGDAGAGSGRGGDLGTPSELLEEAPPSADQEANEAVSGGGMVQPDTEDDAKETVDE
jgi:hypothetical protein